MGLNRPSSWSKAICCLRRSRDDVRCARGNILRDILIRMMPQAAERVAEGGRIVLSGFVTSQEQAIRDAMEKHGFTVEQRLRKEDWVALVGRRAL